MQVTSERSVRPSWLQSPGSCEPPSAGRPFSAITDELRRPLAAESARWGDVRREPPYVPDDNWLVERDWIVETFFPRRPAIVFAQFRRRGLYPPLNPPTLNQYGGAIDYGFRLELNTSTGIAYFTLDGTDPRLVGGEISPFARAADGATKVELDRSTDGGGRSLEIIDPRGPIDWWYVATSWRPSDEIGGTPGRAPSPETGGRQRPGDLALIDSALIARRLDPFFDRATQPSEMLGEPRGIRKVLQLVWIGPEVVKLLLRPRRRQERGAPTALGVEHSHDRQDGVLELLVTAVLQVRPIGMEVTDVLESSRARAANSIEVGSRDARVSVAAELGTEVVGDDPNDVRTRLRRGDRARQKDADKGEFLEHQRVL